MPIPKKLLEEMLADPYYKFCARKGVNCSGRITLEHAFLYAGKQIQEKWAIIPLCWFHHLGAGLNKEINHYIALARANIDELMIRLFKKDWRQMWLYLKFKYENKDLS